MVLGLGVTRLLIGVITVFRTRRNAQVDWLPLAWTACLFLIQLEFWWAINQLPMTRSTYSFPDFVSLVVLTLSLFVASALILPNRPEDESLGLRGYFETEGKFALLAIAAFGVCGFLANLYFFEAPLVSLWALLDVPVILLPVLGFFAKHRSLQVATVSLYLPLLALDVWVSLAT